MTDEHNTQTTGIAADPPPQSMVGIWSDRTILGHGVAAVLSRAHEPWLLRWLGGPMAAETAHLAGVTVVVAAWDHPRTWPQLQMHLASWLDFGAAVVLIGDRPSAASAVHARVPASVRWCPPEASAGIVIGTVAAALTTAEPQGSLPPAPMLSEQETRVVQLVAAGWKVSAVARRLHVSPHTVHTYLRRVRRKFADAGTPVASTLELYREAMRWGLIEGDPAVDASVGSPWSLPALESSA